MPGMTSGMIQPDVVKAVFQGENALNLVGFDQITPHGAHGQCPVLIAAGVVNKIRAKREWRSDYRTDAPIPLPAKSY